MRVILDEAVEASKDPQQDSDEHAKDLKSSEIVWNTIIETWWKSEEELVAWEKQKQSFTSRVSSAKSREEVRKLQRELIDKLKASHYGIIPGELYKKLGVKEDGKIDTSKLGSVGLKYRLVDDQAVVYHVVEGSAADQAGVKPGWLLKSVKDQDVPELIAELKEALTGKRFSVASMVGLRLSNMSDDTLGDKLKLVLLDEKNESHHLDLEMLEPTGKWIRFGNLPPLLLDIENKTLEDGTQYFSFNAFFDPVTLMGQFDKALEEARKSDKLVIDLRGNHGGIGGITMGMGRHLVQEEKYLGKMLFPTNEIKFALSPAADPFSGKVAVLIDECSFSSAEILAGGLQAIGRARVFGSRTGGLALPSIVKKLPNGDFFQYAICDYVSFDGSRIEGNGVAPDEEIPLTQKDLLDGRDRALETATAWMNKVEQ